LLAVVDFLLVGLLDEGDPEGEVGSDVQVVEKQRPESVLVEDSLGSLKDGIDVEESLQMQDVDVPVVFLQVFAVAVVRFVADELRVQRAHLWPFPLEHTVLFLFLTVLLLLPRDRLQNAIGVVVGCVHAIPVDLIVAFQRRGKPLPTAVVGSV
jgi:hypothetical protein